MNAQHIASDDPNAATQPNPLAVAIEELEAKQVFIRRRLAQANAQSRPYLEGQRDAIESALSTLRGAVQ